MSSITPTDFKIKELNGELLPEPLLVPDRTRFVLFPIKHNDVRLPAFRIRIPLRVSGSCAGMRVCVGEGERG